MNRETEEYLHGLYPADPESDNSPRVNWTRGFEADADEYEDYSARDAEPKDAPPPSGWVRFWSDKG